MTNAETIAAQPVTTSKAKIWLYTLGSAVILPAVLWVICDPVAGHSLEAVSGASTMTVGLPWVIGGALIASAIGLGVATLLGRLTKRAKGIWTNIGAIVLLGSLMGPMGGTTVTTILVLVAMHLLVGAAVIIGGYMLAKR